MREGVFPALMVPRTQAVVNGLFGLTEGQVQLSVLSAPLFDR